MLSREYRVTNQNIKSKITNALTMLKASYYAVLCLILKNILLIHFLSSQNSVLSIHQVQKLFDQIQ